MGPAQKGAVELIVYQASKRQFIQDTFANDIEFVLSQQYLRSTGRQPAPAEFRAWQNSLFAVLRGRGATRKYIIIERKNCREVCTGEEYGIVSAHRLGAHGCDNRRLSSCRGRNLKDYARECN